MLYDASQGLQGPDHQSSSRRLRDKGDTLMAEPEPTPTADTPHDIDEMCGHRGVEIETALEQTMDKSRHKNMFRAFDGTALITIGEILQSILLCQCLRVSTGMLLQEHITGFLQRPPMDSNEWDNILFEEDEKQKKQNEWKMKRSKPRKDPPQVSNKTSECSASGSGGDDIMLDNDDGTEEVVPLNGDEEVELEEVVVADHECSGASSDSRAR